MKLRTLVERNLAFFWKTNIGVLLASVVGTAILTGALAVGSSVRFTLGVILRDRLGKTEFAIVGGDKFFRAELADGLSAELRTDTAAVLRLAGVITAGEGENRADRIRVIGVDERFYEVGGMKNPFGREAAGSLVINTALAERLGVREADEVVIRFEKPGLVPREVPLTGQSGPTAAFRLRILAVADENRFGSFNLQAGQIAPFNAFLPLKWLQDKAQLPSRANLLLVAERAEREITAKEAEKALEKCWDLADAGLEFKIIRNGKVIEFTSKSVLIDKAVARAALDLSDRAAGIFTYFVNEIRTRHRSTPYSTVAALNPVATTGTLIPCDLGEGEIVINSWLADDLKVEKGGDIELSYFVLSEENRLEEKSRNFTVRKVIPMEVLSFDADLMPDFEGISGVENCRDWEPGIPVDLGRIREKDEEYWDRYRATPKAFVTLGAGRLMWSSRFGDLTSVRFPAEDLDKETLARQLRGKFTAASVGLFFHPVRQSGGLASNQGTDFGRLFLGLSMFLLLAALVLMGLVFVFGVESRAGQVGILQALGFTPGTVRLLFIAEGCILAVIGAAAGTAGGLLYTWGMLYGLETVWKQAVAGTSLIFHTDLKTLLTGALAGTATALAVIWLAVRRQISRPVRQMLAGGINGLFVGVSGKERCKFSLGLSAVFGVSAFAVIFFAGGGSGGQAESASFFAAGAMLLAAFISFSYFCLAAIRAGFRRPMRSLAGLSLRNTARRLGRSSAIIIMLGSGVFMVTAVAVNRRPFPTSTDRRDSGTGGFELFGQSSIPITRNLNSSQARASLGFRKDLLNDLKVIHLRVHEGDSADCFNLNRAQKPTLLGVGAGQLQLRHSFSFLEVIKGLDLKDGWHLLEKSCQDGVVPAVGDYPSVVWAMGKSLGDEIEYTDDSGRAFKVRIVGIIKTSILQGSLIISKENFVERFPSDGGYKMFLIDTAADGVEAVRDEFSFVLADYGLELVSSARRLAAFSTVENTYLSIFQLLGGLGIILGSAGVGLVVLRNVMDRRGELAMMRAVGFSKARLGKMLIYEHAGLLTWALVCGAVSALLAVGPVLALPGADIPFLSLSAILAAIVITGVAWVWLSTAFSLRGDLLDALRNE